MTPQAQQKVCKRCVLPESEPDIHMNEDGICNVCVEFDKEKTSSKARPALETDFTKILNKYKGRKKYDCLVMCSGGKDSISSLYYMKKRYGLNPLAFTFDTGFESRVQLANVTQTVDVLGVDFLFFKSDYMRDIFSRALKLGSKVVLCHLCSIWHMQLTFDMAAKFDISLIIAGWTKGQAIRKPARPGAECHAPVPEFASMARNTREFIESHVRTDTKYKDFPASMDEVLKKATKKHKSMVLSPLWFLPFDRKTYEELITKELNWSPPKLSYPARTTNCDMNFISAYNAMKYYGYTDHHVEMSKMIREGLLDRDQALKDLEINFSEKLLNNIAEKLDHRFD